MSVQALGWVLDHSTTEGVARLCLIALANHADKETGECWVSIATVAREANCHVDTAKRTIAQLHKAGHIDRAIQASPDSRQRADRKTNLYQVHTDPTIIARLAAKRGGTLPSRSGNTNAKKARTTDGGDLSSGASGGDLPSERGGSPVPDGGDLPSERGGRQIPPNHQGTIREPSENHASEPICATGGGEDPAPAKAGAKTRDLIYETVFRVCYPHADSWKKLTKPANDALNGAVKELKQRHATPELIEAAAQRYRATMAGASLTPHALAKHWLTLTSEVEATAEFGTEFAAWFAAYPSKSGRSAALTAYARRRAEGLSPAELAAVRDRYLATATAGRDGKRFVVAAARLLDERLADFTGVIGAPAAALQDRPATLAHDGAATAWSDWLLANLGVRRPKGLPTFTSDAWDVNYFRRGETICTKVGAPFLVPVVRDPATPAKLRRVCWLPHAAVEWLLSPWCDAKPALAARWLSPLDEKPRQAIADWVHGERLRRLALPELTDTLRSWWEQVQADSLWGAPEHEAEFVQAYEAAEVPKPDPDLTALEVLAQREAWQRWLAHVEQRAEAAA